ncbi:MAG: hypothetical protein R8L53_07110 [Mariprofundales bacterium]
MSFLSAHRLHNTRWYIRVILPVLLLFVLQTIASAACVSPFSQKQDMPIMPAHATNNAQHCHNDTLAQQSGEAAKACAHCQATQNINILSNNTNSMFDANQLVTVTSEAVILLTAIHLFTQPLLALASAIDKNNWQYQTSFSTNTSIIYHTTLRIRT